MFAAILPFLGKAFSMLPMLASKVLPAMSTLSTIGRAGSQMLGIGKNFVSNGSRIVTGAITGMNPGFNNLVSNIGRIGSAGSQMYNLINQSRQGINRTYDRAENDVRRQMGDEFADRGRNMLFDIRDRVYDKIPEVVREAYSDGPRTFRKMEGLGKALSRDPREREKYYKSGYKQDTPFRAQPRAMFTDPNTGAFDQETYTRSNKNYDYLQEQPQGYTRGYMP